MAVELILGSLAALSFAALIIVLMTTNKRVSYSGDQDTGKSTAAKKSGSR